MSSVIRDVKTVNIFEAAAIIHLLTVLGSATHCTQGDGPGHQPQLCVALVSKDVLRRLWERAGLSCAVGSEHYCFHTLENPGLYMFLSSRFSSFPTFIISDGHLEAKFSEPATTFLHLLSQTGRSMEVPRRPSRRPWLQQQIPITVSLVTTFLHLGPLCRIPFSQCQSRPPPNPPTLH